jgi:hypothetical protein
LSQTYGPIDKLLDELLELDPASARYAAVRERLLADAYGRDLLVAHDGLRALGEAAPASDLVQNVSARLPTAGPAAYSRLAAAVLEAWESPQFREELRSDPAKALAASGASLPEGTEYRIVPADKAALPSGALVYVPLPDAADPPMSRTSARQQLARTEFAWLFGAPWETGRGKSDRERRAPTLRWPAITGLARWAVATAAAFAVLVFFLVTSRLGSEAVPGAAIGEGATVVVIAAGIATAVVWWLFARRRS